MDKRNGKPLEFKRIKPRKKPNKSKLLLLLIILVLVVLLWLNADDLMRSLFGRE